MAAKVFSTLTPLPSALAQNDRVVVARDDDLYRSDVKDLPRSFFPRATLQVPDLTTFGTKRTGATDSNANIYELDDGVCLFADWMQTRAGTSIVGWHRPMPSGSWVVEVGCLRGFSTKNYINGGLMLYENGTGKITVFGFGVPSDSGLFDINNYTNSTTFSSQVRAWGEEQMNASMFRALKNGSNIEFYYSFDGVLWILAQTVTLTSFFTTAPDRWGVYLQPNNNGNPKLDLAMDVLHWKESP